MALFYGPLWTAIIVVTIFLTLLFLYVRDITLKAESHITEWAKHQESVTTETPDFEGFVNSDEDDLYRDQGFNEESAQVSTNKLSSVARESVTTQDSEAGRIIKARKKKKAEILSYTKRRRDVANQCLRFSIGFYFTWIPITCVRILQMTEVTVPYALLLAAATVTPLQGLPNMAVFLFPLLKKQLKECRDGRKAPKQDLPPCDEETGQAEQTQEQLLANSIFSNFNKRMVYLHSYVQHESSTSSSDDNLNYVRPEMYMMSASRQSQFSTHSSCHE